MYAAHSYLSELMPVYRYCRVFFLCFFSSICLTALSSRVLEDIVIDIYVVNRYESASKVDEVLK